MKVTEQIIQTKIKERMKKNVNEQIKERRKNECQKANKNKND